MLEQIKASAGSGKTYILTRRFLAHLRGASPYAVFSACALDHGPGAGPARSQTCSLSGILAATFTNKAAAEMQSRVIRELKLRALTAADSPAADPDFPLSPEQSRYWVDVFLRRLDAVNIRTIDSLLTLLVRLNALSLSLPPDFTPVFSLEETLAPLYDGLLDRLASGDPEVEKALRLACKSILLHSRVSGFMAGKILRERLLEVTELFLRGVPLPLPATEEAARAVLGAMHRDLTQSAAALAALTRDENLAMSSNALKFLERCERCRPLEIPRESEYGNKASLDDWLNKASKGKASDDAHRAFADLVTAYGGLTRHGKALLGAVETMPFISLARPLIQALEAMQREEGLVPALRLPTLALQALRAENGVSDAFCRMGDRLTHLLFDEFQDTSTDQWQSILPLAVECLSQGGSLTYVGDVKQAIYSWRGGNAELFDAVAADPELTVMLESGPLASGLPCNWRSAPPIVSFNNAVFGQLADENRAATVLAAMLPSETPGHLVDKARQSLVAAFSGCEQAVPQQNAGKPGLVRLTRIHAPTGPELAENVRDHLHKLLDEVLTRRPAGDIAILVRKNKEAGEVAGWLAEWRIPVVTEHSFCLGNHPLIVRLVDALTFLEYPLDDAAFWSCIVGPELFGADLAGRPGPDALADWLAARRALNGEPLFMAFRRDFPDLWRVTLAPFLDQAGLMSAYDTILELIRLFRVLERCPGQAPFVRRFAEVAHAAENQGHSSLSSFLDFWAEKGKDERVPMPESMNAVRILSMHKAKGLEFPVVIVPFHHQGDPVDSPLIATEVLGLPLVTYRNRHVGDAHYEALIRGVAERLNLLYVAWTRPTEELHAFITETDRSARSSALGKALDVLLRDFAFTDGYYADGVLPAGPASSGLSGPSNPDPDCAEVPVQGANPKPKVTSAPEASADAPATAERPMSWLPRLKIFRNPAEDRGYTERRRGLLAHACLEALHMAGSGADGTDGAVPGTALDAQAVERAVRHAMRTFPLFLPDPDLVRRDMTGILSWYAALPETIHWVRHGSPEQPLLDKGGTLHRVDLLVDAPGSPLLAIEYKTGQPGDEHRTQVQRYLGLLAAAERVRPDGGRAVRGIIVYLDERTLTPVQGVET